MYFSVGGTNKSVADIGGPKPLLFHKFTVAVIILSTNFESGHGRIGPPGSAQVGGPKAAPFGPLDFLQVGGPFREVGGRGLPWMYGNSSTGLLFSRPKWGWHLNIFVTPSDFRPLPHPFVLYAPWIGGSFMSLGLGQPWPCLDLLPLLPLL